MLTYREESELRKPVSGNLRRRGYGRQRNEVQFFDYYMDLYGYAVESGRTTAVELKLTRWMRAFEQALIYQLCADFVYIALPIRVAGRVDIALLSRHGIGLLGVQPDLHCATMIEPEQSTVVISSYRDFYVQLMQERRR
jgi:hypothetical protein